MAHLFSAPGDDSGYRPAYPANHTVGPSLQEFVTRFYQVSDAPGRTDDWVACFHDDATLVMGNDVARGKVEIHRLRQGMWDSVESRRHRVEKVFPAGSGSGPGDDTDTETEAEYMLFGTAAFHFRPAVGRADEVIDWVGHAQVRRASAGEPWKFGFYRVYLQRK